MDIADHADQARLLASYRHDGARREVVARVGAAGSVLVIDHDAATHGDERLVAHIAGDEPAGNAALACARYLADAQRGRCRSLQPDDLRAAPFAHGPRGDAPSAPAGPRAWREPVDAPGCRYVLAHVDAGMSIPELRWCRRAGGWHPGADRVVSVRDVIGHLQSYEPVRARTADALRERPVAASTAVLRGELARVDASPIVLNRGLREAVLAALAGQRLSMSEIAVRCGRVKHDRRGNASGETSWLARRLGLLPEGGRRQPTPWIHSDVLALIARRGLGISPREVELG